MLGVWVSTCSRDLSLAKTNQWNAAVGHDSLIFKSHFMKN